MIGDDGDVDGQLITVVIGTGGDDVHAVDALHLRPFPGGRRTSSSAQRPPIIEDLKSARWKAGPILAPWDKRFCRVTVVGCLFRCVYGEIEV